MLARTVSLALVPVAALVLLGVPAGSSTAAPAPPVAAVGTASEAPAATTSHPGVGTIPSPVLRRPCLSCWAHH